VVFFFWGGKGGALFCGFKILAILQNLLPFCFVEFTLEKKRRRDNLQNNSKFFFYVTKRPKFATKKTMLTVS